MRLVRSLILQIALLATVGLLVFHHVDAAAISVPAGILIVGLLYAYLPKAADQTNLPLPPDLGPGELPGSPDKALIPDLIRARRSRRSNRDGSDT